MNSYRFISVRLCDRDVRSESESEYEVKVHLTIEAQTVEVIA